MAKKQATTVAAEPKAAAVVAEQPAPAAKAPKTTKTGLPALPKMPRARKPKPAQACGCGCGEMTRGGRFLPGHDARLHGWALRLERGLVKAADIPEGERKAAQAYLRAAEKAGTPTATTTAAR